MEWGKTLLTYTPLDSGGGEFRLLLLAPGDEAESIDAVLIHASLDNHPPYESLSYAWGNPSATSPVNVNGCTFLATTNLKAALKRLRHADDERYLWIDAICINQSDISERNDQVTKLHWIYQRAERVVIWLGEHSDDSRAAIKQLEMLSVDDCDGHQVENAHHASRRSPAMLARWVPIYHFFSRSWWSRVWVMQEVVWAAEILVLCGDSQLSWDMLLCAYFNIGSNLKGPELQNSLMIGIARSVSVWTLFTYRILPGKSLPTSLEHTLTIVRQRNSTDPRDRVFGILNIVPISEWPGRPDYSKEVSEVFTTTTKHIIDRTRRLTILCACQRANYTVKRQDHLRKETQHLPIAGLPTWVPDWSTTRLTVPLYGGYEYDDNWSSSSSHAQYYAAKDSVASFKFSENDRILTIKGICYDAVQHTCGPLVKGPFDIHQPEFSDRLESMLYEHFRPLDVSWEGVPIQEVFWRTLTLDRTTEGNKATREEYLEFSRHPWKTTLSQGFLKQAQSACLNRFFFITSKGLMGLGPLKIQPGDLVCVLLGSSVPLILRKTSAHYLVDGDCCEFHHRVSTCLSLGCLTFKAFEKINQHYVVLGETCK